MAVKSVYFKIVEPMMFKGSTEFSPDVTGPQVMARSIILPYPSTIAGALATLVLEGYPSLIPNPDSSKWAEEISQILGVGVKLRGPYLIYDNEMFVQANTDLFIRVNDLLDTNQKKLLKPKFVSTFGIKMDDKRRTVSKPTTDRSMLYSAQMVTYDGSDVYIKTQCGENPDDSAAQMVTYDGSDVYIGIDIINCSSRLEEALSKKKIIRLGGEGRLVAITTSNTPKLHNGKGNYLFIISPVLFETINNVDSAINYDSMLSEIEKYFKINFQKAAFGLIGGFSSTPLRKRKPVYAAIMPGSILKVDSEKEALRLENNGIGLFSDLGFGSAIRISNASLYVE